MSTVADKLRAEGVPLELGDRWVAVKFTNRAKAEVEKRFGSCVVFERSLNEALAKHVGGPIFTVVLDGLAACLLGPKSRWTEEAIDAAIDPGRLVDYLNVLLEAWDQAWPTPKKEEDGQGNADGTTENSSPGTDTSSSPSSTSAAVPMSSGS